MYLETKYAPTVGCERGITDVAGYISPLAMPKHPGVGSGELIRHGTELLNLDRDNAVDFFRTMEIQSSAAAVENLLLAATSLGICSVWLGALFLIKDEVLHLLEEPAGEFMAVAPLGYSEKLRAMPAKKSLEVKVKYL